ncbi:DUF2793 domain-containing protein [Sedimentitalea sp. XS_ASV28]|uniref:DUF2793 domain-containing protein n=1 Tax=Sedimentitalea sp. XS_ASV28 TaxID=3241296 RepID=UPI00351642CD
MPDSSPILALPFLLPGQAQKHVTHNEALRRLDIVVQLSVTEFDAVTPPAAPEDGEIYALGATPVAAWAGQAHALTAWLDGAWHFITPQEGWRAWGRTEAQLRVWTGAAWVLPQAETENLAGIGVGTTSDATNRLAVSADAALLTHDGADHRLKINKAGAGDTASVLFQSNWTGHAEMGLAGETDFSIKVSGDGTGWIEALRFDGISGKAGGAAVQATAEDTAVGALLTVGAFGLGGTLIPTTDFDTLAASGFYFNPGAGADGAPDGAGGWHVIHLQHARAARSQIAFRPGKVRFRRYVGGDWDEWSTVFSQGELLGPVSETGGTPTGAVIERGSNGHGDYVRWADGTQICTNSNAPITTAPADFAGTVTRIDGDKLWIGRWF